MVRKVYVITKVYGKQQYRISKDWTPSSAKKFVGSAKKGGISSAVLTKTQAKKLFGISKKRKIRLTDIKAVKKRK